MTPDVEEILKAIAVPELTLRSLDAEIEAQAAELAQRGHGVVQIAHALPEISDRLGRTEPYRGAVDDMRRRLAQLVDVFPQLDEASRRRVIEFAQSRSVVVHQLGRLFATFCGAYDETGAETSIVKALTTVCMADMSPDFRDTLMVLYDLYVAIRARGQDPMRHFRAMAAIGGTEAKRWLHSFDQTSFFRDVDAGR